MAPEVQDKDGLKVWKQKDKVARNTIALNLKDNPIEAITGCITAHKMWTTLTECCHGKGYQKAALLITEIFRAELNDAELLKPQLNKLVTKGHTLRSLSVKFPDDLLSVTLIISLPPTMLTIKTVLQTQDKLKPNEVIAKIL